MEFQNSNIASIYFVNKIIQYIHPRHEEQVNPKREDDVGLNWNVEIVVALASLRHLSDVFKEGDQFYCSLGKTIDMIIRKIHNAQGALYNITSYRESRWEFYEKGLSYQEVKKLKITKDMLFSLFRDPSNGMVPPTSKPHISIDWCMT